MNWPALKPTAVPIPGSSTDPATAAAIAVLLGRTLGSCSVPLTRKGMANSETGALQLRIDAPVEALIAGHGHLAGGRQQSRLDLEATEVVAVAVHVQAPGEAARIASIPAWLHRARADSLQPLPGRPAAACPPRRGNRTPAPGLP